MGGCQLLRVEWSAVVGGVLQEQMYESGGWAERSGVARVTAYRWFRAGLLPVSARRVGRLILVGEPTGEAGPRARAAVCARVSSADQKADLDRWVARVTVWATG